MKFELPDKGAHVMNQEMMYTSEGTNYWWNYTGNYQLDDYKGVWKNEDGDGTNTDMYSRFWSSVFACAEFKASTRLRFERTRQFRPNLFGRASKTRREQSIRPKISRIDFDLTEIERFEVSLDRSFPARASACSATAMTFFLGPKPVA